MEIIPAIDLRGGKCVRLYQGDYGRETVYSEDPIEVARHWVSLGATRLHVVDLDGARGGAPQHLSIVEAMASSVSVPIQLGGGVRTIETASALVSVGVQRVIVGTAAVENPGLVQAICAELGPEAVVVGVDARDGYVAVKGWTRRSELSAVELVRKMADIGVQRIMYTDIARDGTLTEPNFDAIETLVNRTGPRLIAAGGISSEGHLVRCARLGVEAVVVGKALYTGDIQLRAAIEAIRNLSS